MNSPNRLVYALFFGLSLVITKKQALKWLNGKF